MSTTTVIRIFTLLGYNGYASFQADLFGRPVRDFGNMGGNAAQVSVLQLCRVIRITAFCPLIGSLLQ